MFVQKVPVRRSRNNSALCCSSSSESTSVFTSKRYVEQHRFPVKEHVSLADARALSSYADNTFVTESAKIEYCLSKGLDYKNAIKYIPVVESMTKILYAKDDE
jgi:hypothetical protein